MTSGNAQEVLKQFVRITKHIKSGTEPKFFNPLCREVSINLLESIL